MRSRYYRPPLPHRGAPLRICSRCEQQEWRARQYSMLMPRKYRCRVCRMRTCSHLANDKREDDRSCVCPNCRDNAREKQP